MSCDETVIEVDFVELKVGKKFKKNLSLVFTLLQPLVRLTNNFRNVLPELTITTFCNFSKR